MPFGSHGIWVQPDVFGLFSESVGTGVHKAGLPEHLIHHLVTMAALHRAGRYDRMADGVERVTGRPAMSVRDFVALHAEEFGGRRS